jgi:hypothetical protein
MVHAHDEEDRLPVRRVLGAGRDLDAVHVAAEQALVVERYRADERWVSHRQLLEPEVVVRQVAIRVAAARQPGYGRGPRVRDITPVVPLRTGRQVRDPDVVAEARPPQRASVGPAVQHDLDRILVAVLGQIEPERLQAGLVGTRARTDVDHLHRAGLPLCNLREADRQLGACGVAAEAALLNGEALAPADEALGERVAVVAGLRGFPIWSSDY